jgi:hypothetical protein
MGALWELPGSSLGAHWELVAVEGIPILKSGIHSDGHFFLNCLLIVVILIHKVVEDTLLFLLTVLEKDWT